MFRKSKDNELDIKTLNGIIRTGNRILNIFYFLVIVSLVLVGTFIIKEWKIFSLIKDIVIVISPLFIGFLIAWLFDPLVTKLQNKKVPRIIGCILAYLLIVGFIFIIGYMFIPTLANQVKDFVNAAPDIFDELTDFLINLIKKIDLNSILNTNEIKKNITKFVSEFGLSIASDIPKYIISSGKAIVSGGLNVVLGLMVGFYLLFDFNKVNTAIENILPQNWKHNYKDLTGRINTSLRSYVQGVLLIMLLVFITQSIGLTIAGMEAPMLFALFCAVTDIIPYFGPYIGGIPAVIVGFTISPITGICVLISILIVQLLENNFYQPLIMGHTMKLHPVTIMLGLLIFQNFFGIIGMVIATPVIASLKVLITFIIEKIKEAKNENEPVKEEQIKQEKKLIKAKTKA